MKRPSARRQVTRTPVVQTVATDQVGPLSTLEEIDAQLASLDVEAVSVTLRLPDDRLVCGRGASALEVVRDALEMAARVPRRMGAGR